MRFAMRFAGVVFVCAAAGAVCAQQSLTPKSETQKAIVKLSEQLDADDVSYLAERLVKENDSCDISSVFVNSKTRGLGIGALADAGFRDGIEALVVDLTKKPTPYEVLVKHQGDFDKIAKVLQAMAELAPHRNPFRSARDARTAEWNKVSAEFKVATREFRDVFLTRDPTKVQTVTQKLHQACQNCHKFVF